ncbi:DUF2306 domain-containing protein [Paenibacillus radicis (ex Xue et al. 2023)]|uniref:DUF2306 domain-containing protein n=1 Tax=Paenibacillus radicis (ex Xue et al. 2023) TaxID=2972489 RepID=A0ABT1YU52_9BACL|nr:DUF2306 domain-containing protein [Paenibacillus radicis (ex Xue et al. 2023)]MCR8635849.1 DUF2306 domain-containing protein [Paenibacillus radicis (ex Xue et al. 2023)]
MKHKSGWYLLFGISIAVGIAAAAPYMTLNPENSRVALNPAFSWYYLVLVAHIITAFIALASGPFQFSKGLRARQPVLHRTLGRLYVICIGISGILGLVITLYITSFVKALAFLTLCILWLFTVWKGYRTARSKQFDAHRLWMVRSYAITLVAVTARLIVPLCILLYAALHGFTIPGGRESMIANILEVNIWIGLVVNIVIVEWCMMKKQLF